MKQIPLLLRFLSFSLFTMSIYLQCSSVSSRYCNELTAQYPGTGPYTLVESTLVDGLNHMFFTFDDTVPDDTTVYLWNAYRKQSPESFIANTEPLIQNIPVMAAVLKNRGYTVVTEQPDSYESIFALSKLPVLIWALIIHHPDKKSPLITDKDVSLHKVTKLTPYIDDIQLHLITSIVRSGETYKITTRDGLSFNGLANDNINAQILTENEEESTNYIQIVDCFFISSLPLVEIEQHIEDWYSRTPYEYVKPEILEF